MLDGAIRFDKLAARIKELGMTSYALTDHGSLFGVVKFTETMEKAGIKPIIGCEMYITDDMNVKEKGTKAFHLVTLVKNKTGYQNLIKMVSRSYIDGFYYKPRIDKKLLAEFSEGLIGLSACIQGEIPRAILAGDMKRAYSLANEYKEIFHGDFFIEIQKHGMVEEHEINSGLLEISRKLDIPPVVTNDIHYLTKDDFEAHEALLCIQTKTTMADPPDSRLSMPTNTFYIRSAQEMKALFPECPEAAANSLYIADMCRFSLSDDIKNNPLHFPYFEVPASHTQDTYLRELCEKGLQRKYPEITDEIKTRLEYELGVVTGSKLSGYFLIVWDFIKYAKDHDIPVGPGRGSAAGSIVSYVLDITEIDPLRYDLLFERFLNPDRVEMPDIDVDIADNGRQEVIDYVAKKYGEDHVCQIATFGTMKARAVIRDVARVFGVDLKKTDKLAKIIPPMAKSLEQVLIEDKDIKKVIQDDEEYQKIYDIALRLEGLARHVSKHAAGVIIADDVLENIAPLYRDKDGNITTQFDKIDTEKIGLLKIDFLGLKNLSIIQDAVKRVQHLYHIPIDINTIDITDQKVYQMLGEGKTYGIFQFESAGMREYLKKLKPERLEDLIAMNALYRPGPIDMIPTYIKRKQGIEPVKYNFEAEMKPILDMTYGVITYQEQAMKIANVVGGFTMGEADVLRKAMAKKKAKLIEELGEKFLSNALKKGMDEAKVQEVWNTIAKFGEYGFNKSHSACYAFVAYQTAYLKAHYPTEYMAALLTNDANDTTRIASGIKECHIMGIDVLLPDINRSFVDFRSENGAIRYALAAIKNVGEAAMIAIVQDREENGPYKSLFDFFSRIDHRTVNRKVTEYLVYSGALDCFGIPRRMVFDNLDRLSEYGRTSQEQKSRGAVSLFGEEAAISDAAELDVFPEWERNYQLKREKEALGLYLSGHILDEHKKAIATYATGDIASIKEKIQSLGRKDIFILGGVFTVVQKRATKEGKKYIMAEFEDLTDRITVMVFNKSLERNESFIIEDEFLFIKGNAQADEREGGNDENEDGGQTVAAKFFLEDVLQPETVYGMKKKCVNITCPLENWDEEKMEKLRETISAYPGDDIVRLHIAQNGGYTVSIQVGNGFTVTATPDFEQKLREIFGTNAVLKEIVP